MVGTSHGLRYRRKPLPVITLQPRSLTFQNNFDDDKYHDSDDDDVVATGAGFKGLGLSRPRRRASLVAVRMLVGLLLAGDIPRQGQGKDLREDHVRPHHHFTYWHWPKPWVYLAALGPGSQPPLPAMADRAAPGLGAGPRLVPQDPALRPETG